MLFITQKNIKISLIVSILTLIWFFNISNNKLHSLGKSETLSNQTILRQQIKQANQSVLQQRDFLLLAYRHYLHHHAIGSYAVNKIQSLWVHYIFFNPYDKQDWRSLINKTDVIPNKILLYQVVTEHAANNLYGMYTYKPGFGDSSVKIPAAVKQINWLTPADLQAAHYPNITTAILDYAWSLNSSSEYKPFRQLRSQLRKQHKSIKHWFQPSLITLTRPTHYATQSPYSNFLTSPVYP